jgi:predicted dinucleotide-binding enzyme
VIVIALPAQGLPATLAGGARGLPRQVVIRPSWRSRSAGRGSSRLPAGRLVGGGGAGLLPDAKVGAAFHHIAPTSFSETEHAIECDLLMCGR